MSKPVVHHEKALGNNLILTTNNQRQLRGPRSDSPLPQSTSTTYQHVCILCEKKSGYFEGKRNRPVKEKVVVHCLLSLRLRPTNVRGHQIFVTLFLKLVRSNRSSSASLQEVVSVDPFNKARSR